MSKWISADERLPEREAEVWVCFKVGHEQRVTVATYWGDDWYRNYWMVDDWRIDGVTHWQPLERPAPPAVVDVPIEDTMNRLEVGC